MTTLTLNTVRFYTDTDVYNYTVDNRPLQDLASNDALLQEAFESVKQIMTESGSVTVGSGPEVTIFYNTPILGTSTITPVPNPSAGDTMRIVRSAAATGAFSVTFNGKSLTNAGTFVLWQFDGTNWQQIGAGTLI